MEKIVKQTMLYDFYGELLTDHQKSVYEDIIINDLSYSEIARLNNISRQGAYDMVKRCDKILEDYEKNLRLVEKFLKAKDQVEKLLELIEELRIENKDDALIKKIDEMTTISNEILQGF